MKINIANNYRWERCPLCASNVIDFLGDIEYRKPVMFSTYLIGLQEKPSLYRCSSCHSWFTQNIVRENEAYEIYQRGNSNIKWPKQICLSKEKPRNILSRLDQYFLEGKKVLDVGCNTGSLLDYASSKGCNTSGIEPSLSSQLLIHQKGHRLVSSIDEADDEYDVVTAFDLVEHLYDLPGFIEKTRTLLAKDGVLILLTGDICSLSARLSRNNWWYLKAPEHIVFPSRYYLQNLDNFQQISVDDTYASVGYMRNLFIRIAHLIRKSLHGRYDGLPPLMPDHMLVVLSRD